MKKILIISVFIALISTSFSQVAPKYNLYNQNLYLLNPAAIGVNGGINASVGHKTQWVGINNAPQSTYITIDGLLTKSMGVGFIANTQSMGALNMTNIGVNYAYRIGLSSSQAISFGISAYFLQNSIKKDNLNSEELLDPALGSNNFNESLFYNGLGIEYRYKGLSVDLSVPLFYSLQENKFFQSNYLYLAYDFKFGGDIWKLQPSTLLKYYPSSPFQADVNLLADWNSLVWSQVSYRTNNEMLFAVGVFVKYVGIGYAYELIMNPMSYASGGSHEIMIFFDFPVSFSKKKPLYYDGRRRSSWN